MDENNDPSVHRRTTTAPQSIPLQDLSRPPESLQPQDPHRRTLSDRGRRLFASTRQSGRYAALSAAGSPTEQRSDPFTDPPPRPHTDGISPSSSQDDADDQRTPLVDLTAFQHAIGFSGLTFDGEDLSTPLGASSLPDGRRGLSYMVGHNDSQLSLASLDLGDHDLDSLPIDYGDNVPLNSTNTISPNAGLPPPKPASPSGKSNQRTSTQSVRFDTTAEGPRSARLGDDLNTAEMGEWSNSPDRRASTSRPRSVSPASTFLRAGTVVRKMSQRVVNLTNEPELVEQEVRRRHSGRKSDVSQLDQLDPHLSHDGSKSPVEKMSSPDPISRPAHSGDWVRFGNPLRGNSLGIFPPDSKLRTKLCDILVHPITEPVILLLIVLQTIFLVVDAAPNVLNDPRSSRWGSSWIDYALLALFSLYTFEVGAKMIVSGFIINPIEYSTINRQIGLKQAFQAKAQSLFALERQHSVKRAHPELDHDEPPQQSIFRTFTGAHGNIGYTHDSRHPNRVRLAHRAFLRHSFNRVDFLAIIAYWISFGLQLTALESSRHIYAFSMLSCLRILRLLSLTSGTSIILRSLKKAAPLLLNVALLIGFFWLLFAIVGVQSFKSSLRRNCVWVDPLGIQANYTTNQYGNFQFCGGSQDINGNKLPWFKPDNTSSGVTKGYLCPPDSYCVEGSNPYNGTVSYDNIVQSLEMVFVIMTSNTYTDIMYYLTDSDYLIAALFYAIGIVVMTFWLMNLLIAVITSSFQVIRDESRSSAFTADEPEVAEKVERPTRTKRNILKIWYDKSILFWNLLIAYGLICMCLVSSNMSSSRAGFINVSEKVVTLFLLAEIIIRFSVDWRHFFRVRRNCVDLALAIITAVIQIPIIHNSGQPYAWLTIFQILRIYRLVLAVPWTRDLILLVLGRVTGIANLILFAFLLTFLAAILASQLFRGELPAQGEAGNTIKVGFFTIFNSFLGMYQILSSENWTSILYNVTAYDVGWNTAWIGAIFFILWFTLGYFIVLNMFIAVIQENFDVSEDEKRLQQVKAFLQSKELGGSSNSTLALSSMFKLKTLTGRRQDPLDYGPAMMEMLLKDAVVKDFLDENGEPANGDGPEPKPNSSRPVSSMSFSHGPVNRLWSRMKSAIWDGERNPFYSNHQFSNAYEDVDARAMAQRVVSATENRKRAQREYLIKYPRYNVSLYIFKPNSPIRRMCQKVVGPGRGSERIEGSPPSPLVWYAFSATIYAIIVAMVLLACITTPLYQKDYWTSHVYSVRNWFVFTDLAFAVIFAVEAGIRIIADGFFWTPNAYFRSSWGLIDGIVLITLWINVGSSLFNEGAVSRAVGAFKALRALRLLNVSDSARDTFHSVIVRGGWKVLSAAFVSLSLLIPFAIYGLQLFNGQMYGCNDQNSNIDQLNDCVNEYYSTPSNWNVLAPRQVSNPYYDFDNFGNSLFILFQIVSQEGWIDVMWSAQSITGVYTQPQPFSQQGNAIFFVIFNLLGAVFVLTLFVSVFMRNYTEQTGVAFLTTEQRSWLELRKLLRQMSPSKRPPSTKDRATWQQWCYRRASQKTGRWQRFYTLVLVFQLILLCIEFYPDVLWWDITRDTIFFVLTLFYISNIAIRIIGLTWTRFRRSAWDVYSIVAVGGAFVMSILIFSKYDQKVYTQIHKLFLVSVVLLLIPRNNQLDQLFKTAAASLEVVGNLLATWFVLFLVYAIALTQTFGLTRFASQETDNLNFRDVPKALIVLFRTSTGEGWNQIMEDFASITSPFCTENDNFLLNDCGSPSWARALFISWNILSMYIFVNMFVSLIYESFSYVYQRSSGLSVISRKETRRFKQAWAEFDPEGRGYITKEAFPRLLGELSGVFEMRIYPEAFTIGSLKRSCKINHRESTLPIGSDGTVDEIDVRLLNDRLSVMPVEEIQDRRRRLNIFYEEVMDSADPDRGIAFTTVLMILAHYKVINDNKSLRLEEFLRRRARLQRVDEDVRRRTVINFFDTLYWSRRFRKHMASKNAARMTTIPQLQVPEIFVEDEDSSPTREDKVGKRPPPLSLNVPSLRVIDQGTSASGVDVPQSPPGKLRNRNNSIQISPMASPLASPGQHNDQLTPQLSPGLRGGSPRLNTTAWIDESGVPPSSPIEGRSSEDNRGHDRSRANSSVSARSVLEALDNSAWGESMRRSFTLKRPGAGGGSK